MHGCSGFRSCGLEGRGSGKGVGDRGWGVWFSVHGVGGRQSLAEREEGVVLPVPERRHVPGRLLEWCRIRDSVSSEHGTYQKSLCLDPSPLCLHPACHTLHLTPYTPHPTPQGQILARLQSS